MATEKNPRRNPHSGRARGSTKQTGNKGAKRSPMSRAFLNSINKGAQIAPVPAREPWTGVEHIAPGTEYDAEQARKNKELGYC